MKCSCFMNPDESSQCLWALQSSVADFKTQCAGLCTQTKLQLCVSLLYQQPTTCNFNPPQIYMQKKKKSVNLMIKRRHLQGGFFIASDLNLSCHHPCAPLRHQNFFGLPYPNLTAQWMCTSPSQQLRRPSMLLHGHK